MSVFPNRSKAVKATSTSKATDWTAPVTVPREEEGLVAKPARSVTPRILLISIVLIFINCYWIMETEGIWHSNHETAMSLMWNTVFFLLLSADGGLIGR